MKIKIKFKLYLLVNLLKKRLKQVGSLIHSRTEIESIQQVALKLNGAAQYRVTTFDENIFTLGDIGTVAGSDGNEYNICDWCI